MYSQWVGFNWQSFAAKMAAAKGLVETK